MTIDTNLKEFATDTQARYLDAVNKHGSYGKAAKALGASRSAMVDAISRLKKNAALKGYSPDHDMTRTVPDGFVVKGVSTYYDKDGKPSGQWVKSTVDQERVKELMREFINTLAQDAKGLAKITKPPKISDEDLLCIYPMGDPHFGLHAWWQDAGEDFDLEIAERLTNGAIDRLVSTAPNAHTALLLNLGDMFHADNQKNLTQSGHQLDVDGRWAKVQQVGLRSMIYCVQRLLEKHQNVIFRINKGNHDGHSSYALALMLSCYFHNEPRIKVDLSPAVCWYYQFHKVLIASTHGDTIKDQAMAGIMATDMPEAWGATKHRYWFVGHIHHKYIKEYPGAIVEYFRTTAARDAWHSGQGYRAGRDMCLIVMHKDHGEIERHRCDVAMLKPEML